MGWFYAFRAAIVVVLLVFIPATAGAEDRDTYRQVVERMRDGENYYSAAAAELREGDFPLKPALAFRPPTLAWLLSWLPNTAARFILLVGLVAIASLAWARSLSDFSALYRIASVILLVCGLANAGGPASAYLHEAWAIVFMVLALAFYRHIWLCAVLALVAVLLRETALVFVAALGAVAVRHADWRRVWIMTGLVAVSLVLWAVHAYFAALQAVPGDPTSPGWLYFEGPKLILAASRWNLLTSQLPDVALVGALAVMALGLAQVKRPALQVAATTVGFFWLALLALGRPENNYWGIMFEPFMGLGLPDLWLSLRKPRQATTQSDGGLTVDR